MIDSTWFAYRYLFKKLQSRLVAQTPHWLCRWAAPCPWRRAEGGDGDLFQPVMNPFWDGVSIFVVRQMFAYVSGLWSVFFWVIVYAVFLTDNICRFMASHGLWFFFSWGKPPRARPGWWQDAFRGTRRYAGGSKHTREAGACLCSSVFFFRSKSFITQTWGLGYNWTEYSQLGKLHVINPDISSSPL